MQRAQEEASLGGFAAARRCCRKFDAVIDRVANDVSQRVANRLDEGLVELGLFTLHLDADLLAACEGEVAHDSGKFVPDVADGLHPGLHDPFLQFRGDQIQALRGAEEAGFLLAQRELQNLIADQHQLADQVHHLVEQVDVDPDAALGGGRSSRRFMDVFRLRCGRIGCDHRGRRRRHAFLDDRGRGRCDGNRDRFIGCGGACRFCLARRFRLLGSRDDHLNGMAPALGLRPQARRLAVQQVRFFNGRRNRCCSRCFRARTRRLPGRLARPGVPLVRHSRCRRRCCQPRSSRASAGPHQRWRAGLT